MEYTNLGRTGLKVSRLCLGCMTFGREIDEAASLPIIQCALDQGVNFFDTANVYAQGGAEEFLGEGLAKRPRDSYILGTKLFWPMNGDRGLSREQVFKQLDLSLGRLRTEYVDLYQPARLDPVRAYLRAQQRFREPLIASLEDDPATVAWVTPPLLARNSQLVWTWDFLSLVVCLNWAPRTAREAPSADGAVDLEIAPGPRTASAILAPWPFDEPGSLTVRCDARRLEGRFDSEGELRLALAHAPWERLEFDLLAGA